MFRINVVCEKKVIEKLVDVNQFVPIGSKLLFGKNLYKIEDIVVNYSVLRAVYYVVKIN